MAGAIAGTAILHIPGPQDTLHTVTLTVNNTCNLLCPHCYLQYNGDKTTLSPSVIQLLSKSRFRHLAIVGKEPLVTPDSAALCEELIRSFSKSDTTVGLITNGLNLGLLSQDALTTLLYVDVSLDAGPQYYSHYRRASWARVVKGIAAARERGARRINALHTLSSRTARYIDDMFAVRDHADLDLIMLSPYVATHNHGSNTVQELDLHTLLDVVRRCEGFRADPRSILLLDWHYLQKHGYDEPTLHCAVEELQLQDKVRAVVHDSLAFGIVRVTYDGWILRPDDSLHPATYDACGLCAADALTAGLDLSDMYHDMLGQKV